MGFEEFTNFTCGPITILGQDFAQHSDALRSVAFVEQFVELLAGSFAASLLDGPFDVVHRHAVPASFVDRVAQSQIGVRICPAMLSCHIDGTRKCGEQLAAFVVDACFLAGDIRPVGMTCHEM